jgi:hypothetical protein
MNFKDLKEKYNTLDINHPDEHSLIIEDYIIRDNGDIYLSRSGWTAGLTRPLSIHTQIATDRTPEQIDMFLQAIL